MDIKELEQLDIDVLAEANKDEEKPEFTISTASEANWAITKIIEEQHRFELYEDVATDEINRLKEELKEEKRKSKARTQFLRYKLGEYLDNDDVPAKKTKTKMTLKLPAGTIVKTLPHMNYFAYGTDNPNNSPELIEFVKNTAPEYLKVEESVKWGELKKQLSYDDERNVIFNPTGEYIECINLELVPSEVKVE